MYLGWIELKIFLLNNRNDTIKFYDQNLWILRFHECLDKNFLKSRNLFEFDNAFKYWLFTEKILHEVWDLYRFNFSNINISYSNI